jgi:hypothetical protein
MAPMSAIMNRTCWYMEWRRLLRADMTSASWNARCACTAENASPAFCRRFEGRETLAHAF